MSDLIGLSDAQLRPGLKRIFRFRTVCPGSMISG